MNIFTKIKKLTRRVERLQNELHNKDQELEKFKESKAYESLMLAHEQLKMEVQLLFFAYDRHDMTNFREQRKKIKELL